MISVSQPDFERLYISRAEYNALRAELAQARGTITNKDIVLVAYRAELAQAKGEIARLQGIVDIRVDSESQYPGGE